MLPDSLHDLNLHGSVRSAIIFFIHCCKNQPFDIVVRIIFHCLASEILIINQRITAMSKFFIVVIAENKNYFGKTVGGFFQFFIRHKIITQDQISVGLTFLYHLLEKKPDLFRTVFSEKFGVHQNREQIFFVKVSVDLPEEIRVKISAVNGHQSNGICLNCRRVCPDN